MIEKRDDADTKIFRFLFRGFGSMKNSLTGSLINGMNTTPTTTSNEYQIEYSLKCERHCRETDLRCMRYV